MTSQDAKLKIKMLLNSYKDHDLNETEIETISIVISTLMYSEHSTRIMWYSGMEHVASRISNALKKQGDDLIKMMNLSKEEEKELRAKVKNKIKVKTKKVEN